jgi:cytoskeletal protein CcmA (bactofilin family)
MWKFGKDEAKPGPASPQKSGTLTTPQAPAQATPKEAYFMETLKPAQTVRADVAHIGKSVVIKGELSGSEDLYLDGEVEGTIELPGHALTIGPNGRARANVHARHVIVHGKVEGNLYASELVDLRKAAVVAGDISTQRIAIEDGAYFKGGIDIQKGEKSEQKLEPKTTMAPPLATPAAGPKPGQGVLVASQ